MNKITKHDANIIGAMKSTNFTDEEIREAIENSVEIIDWNVILFGICILIIIFLVIVGVIYCTLQN